MKSAPAEDLTVLQDGDLLRVVKYICDLKNNKPNLEGDDIDHLGEIVVSVQWVS